MKGKACGRLVKAKMKGRRGRERGRKACVWKDIQGKEGREKHVTNSI